MLLRTLFEGERIVYEKTNSTQATTIFGFIVLLVSILDVLSFVPRIMNKSFVYTTMGGHILVAIQNSLMIGFSIDILCYLLYIWYLVKNDNNSIDDTPFYIPRFNTTDEEWGFFVVMTFSISLLNFLSLAMVGIETLLS